mmetsp:Transcript_30688/g.55961  ORF Transcript_30688/g.55961 Transcript_30688/m.55961 type:complete len:95 (-) Transcript_30688:32-316(-)
MWATLLATCAFALLAWTTGALSVQSKPFNVAAPLLSKAEACDYCKDTGCGICYAVQCPSGCALTPPFQVPDYTWFCSKIMGMSPWPGVRKEDKC